MGEPMKRVIAALMMVVLAACGGDGSVDPAASSSGKSADTEAALKQQVRSYVDDLFDKKLSAADAYATLSKRCKAEKSFSEFGGEYLLAMGLVESFYGKGAKAGTITVTNFAGGRGAVQTEILTGKGDVATDGADDIDEWVYEDGQWRMDSECEKTS